MLLGMQMRWKIQGALLCDKLVVRLIFSILIEIHRKLSKYELYILNLSSFELLNSV